MQPSVALPPRRSLVAALVISVLSTQAFAQAPAKSPTADIDVDVARVLKTFDVPGIGLAIVKDGRVVLAKGYGVRKLGEPAPVDERTLFGIASCARTPM